MNDLIKDITPSELQHISTRITDGVGSIIEQSKRTIAVYLNSEVSMTYWKIGKYIAGELDAIGEDKYGAKIVSTVSRLLTERFGTGYQRANIFRMLRVAREFPDEEIVSTLSRQLTWSHFVELSVISDPTKRLFYQQMSILYHWSVRQLRDQEDKMVYERSLIAAKPEDEQVKVLTTVADGDITPDVILKSSYVVDFLGLKREFSEEELEDAVVEQLEKFIMELGQDFAFLERQKKIPVDSIDYKLDLLFYHRRLHRLLAIDLKLGKFKPEYKGQMELYLKYLKKYEMQPGEEDPIGLLLCSEGNTEHIELLMLDEQNIKVAQYLTVLPEKQWFIDKMNRSIAIARELQDRKEAE
jgi:predicted nuclease of restriction endonuclease-like (RecB) superfamily